MSEFKLIFNQINILEPSLWMWISERLYVFASLYQIDQGEPLTFCPLIADWGNSTAPLQPSLVPLPTHTLDSGQ